MPWRVALLSVALGAFLMSGDRTEGASPQSDAQTPSAAQRADPLNPLAERYVKLVLALGQHDADYVDAFYGPPDWRTEAEQTKMPLDQIAKNATALIGAIDGIGAGVEGADDLWRLRHQYLTRQLGALQQRVVMLRGTTLSFNDESRGLYDASAPHHSEAEFANTLEQLEQRLPGEGPLIERYDRFKQAFVIPRERLDRVFQAAIRGCKDRTLAHIELPATETFTVEYVTDKSWGGYNWYQGNYRSLIQVNTDLPIFVERALDLACHEGYPGHHVYNMLLEKNLMRDRGWMEYSVYALFSPQSLIAEGTANYGIEVAFPKDERLVFERDVIFPLAGLDPARAKDYYGVTDLVDQLSYAGNEAARQYLDGTINRAQAASWLARYAMMPQARAEQRVRFFDQYRSYVINYNLGRDLVAAYLQRRVGSDTSPGKRWREFAALLSSPRLPSGLK